MSNENDKEVQAPVQTGEPVQAVSEKAPVEDGKDGKDGKTEQVVEPVVTEPVAQSTHAEPVFFYGGSQVVKKTGNVDADGSYECVLANGTAGFVPKSIFGE